MQTILGANGTIGSILSNELINYTNSIRLVSRNPKKANPYCELFPADLTDQNQVNKAIEGSKVVYLLVGFEYKTKVWQEQWPKLMKNTLDSCEKHGAKLVFFDNMYLYDANHLSDMTESTPIKPISKKGKVRAEIAQLLMDRVEKGTIKASIARAADFYGPNNESSMLIEMVYKNLKKGKKANWLVRSDKMHSFTFTPDAAKATALLGNTPDSYNQVWHLPTSAEKLTLSELVQMMATEMKASSKIIHLQSWLLKLLGVFSPLLKEMPEMMYQYDRDYFFNSSKFDTRFGTFATSYHKGIQSILQSEK